MGLGFLELEDPGAVLELIAVVELGVVAGLLSSDPSGTDFLMLMRSALAKLG
jgi:hypothetical protein